MPQSKFNTQPVPVANNHPAIWDLVVDDFKNDFKIESAEDFLYKEAVGLALAIKGRILGSPELNDILTSALEDVKSRNEFGIKKYGIPLQPFNGRNALQDAYEEVLDLVAYVRQVKYERDNASNS
ncbi:MAG TPA: hypothetical protein VFM18_21945 [Methanosarcina sp.]|nr:hypothetical protein [Methanosarcina sp.]